RRLRWLSHANLEGLRGVGSQPSWETCSVSCSEGVSGHLRIVEDLILLTHTTATGRLRPGLKLLGFLLLSSTVGCSHAWCICQEGLAQRILPPLNLAMNEEHPSTKKTAQEAADGNQARLAQPKPPEQANSVQANLVAPPQGGDVSCEPGQT